jgi:hypothetical protein
MVGAKLVTTPYQIPERCQFCKKNPVHFTGHGIRDGLVYDEFSCVGCYAKHGNLSHERAQRILADMDEPELKTPPVEALSDRTDERTPDLPKDSLPEALVIRV